MCYKSSIRMDARHKSSDSTSNTDFNFLLVKRKAIIYELCKKKKKKIKKKWVSSLKTLEN